MTKWTHHISSKYRSLQMYWDKTKIRTYIRMADIWSWIPYEYGLYQSETLYRIELSAEVLCKISHKSKVFAISISTIFFLV